MCDLASIFGGTCKKFAYNGGFSGICSCTNTVAHNIKDIDNSTQKIVCCTLKIGHNRNMIKIIWI